MSFYINKSECHLTFANCQFIENYYFSVNLIFIPMLFELSDGNSKTFFNYMCLYDSDISNAIEKIHFLNTKLLTY